METCSICNCALIRDTMPSENYTRLKPMALIVGEFPGDEEVRRGLVFAGATGQILMRELARAKLPINNFWYTNLWLHKPKISGGKVVNSPCLNLMKERLNEKIRSATFVLLLGSELSKVYLNHGVMEYSGLRVSIPEFENQIIYVGPNPAICMHEGAGEFRLAIRRFAEALEGS